MRGRLGTGTERVIQGGQGCVHVRDSTPESLPSSYRGRDGNRRPPGACGKRRLDDERESAAECAERGRSYPHPVRRYVEHEAAYGVDGQQLEAGEAGEDEKRVEPDDGDEWAVPEDVAIRSGRSRRVPSGHGWAGTRDPAAYLTVPKAIEVHATFDLERARALANEAERRLGELGLPRIEGVPAPFMRAVQLPPGDPDELWGRLYEELRVEVPVYEWEGRRVLRVSIGPYNDEADLDRLIAALEQLL